MAAQFIFDRARSGLAVRSGAAGAARVVQQRSCAACLLLLFPWGAAGLPADLMWTVSSLTVPLDQMSCNLEFYP